MSNYHAHPDWQALLAGIIANPADDLRRLVASDWLTENGEPEYGEFVHVQVEMAKLGWPDCPVCPMSLRLRELWGHGGPVRGIFRRECPALVGVPLHLVPPADDARSPYAIVRRGFVAEVRCRLADWTGGECGRCGGDGRAHGADRPFEWSADTDYGKCVICKGTGRVEGIGESVVASHPVKTVTITDREPMEVFADVWCWGRSFTDVLEERHRLPERVFNLLSGIASQVERVDFATREAALDALSAALILHAKGD